MKELKKTSENSNGLQESNKNVKEKVKLSPQQTTETYRVIRC
jgi:hypothetical protein